MGYIPPEQYASTPAYDLLDAAAAGFIGVDRRLIHRLVDEPDRTLPDILRFCERGLLEGDLIAILRHLGTPEAAPYFVRLVRDYIEDVPEDLTEAIVALHGAALEPLFSLYGEVDGEQGSEVAFLLAGLGVRDPRILDILLGRLECDASEGAISLALYGDSAAIPHLERMLAAPPRTDDMRLRQELSNAIRDIRESQTGDPIPDPPFDIYELYPEQAGPDFELLSEDARLALLTPETPAQVRAGAAASFRNETLSPAARKSIEQIAKTDADANVRGRAWEALSSCAAEPELRAAMLEAARNAPLDERTGAVVALASGPETEDEPSVTAELVEPLYSYSPTRAKALEAMWKSLDRSFAGYFPQHLNDPNPDIRHEAILGAGYLGIASVAPKLIEIFEDDEFRYDALLAYALCAPLDVSRGRIKPFLRKIDQLAHLTYAERELVEQALDQRLMAHGLKPVFDPDDDPGELAPPEPVSKTKPGRNDLCPCGSGKKFKKCCGA